ncbi:MAG TPA: carboxypeptidase-like regulatory domain-containing protein [Thermoanaerobaculia bacterium]
MRLFLQDGPARLQILSRTHLREFRDVGAAREFLRPLLLHAGNRAALRGAMSAMPSWSDDELLEQLARKMVHEGMQIVSCADSYLASLQGTFTEAAAASSAATAAATTEPATTPLQDEEAAKEEQPPPADEQHWIEVELLDDEGQPIADEAYVVELPDGSQKTGRTGADGRARIDGVDPGTAKVSFPDLDKKLYGG